MTILRFFFFTFLSSVFFFTDTNGQDKNIRLQLKWWHQFQFAGYYAAEVKGYYKDEGLEVQIIPGDKDHAPAKEVLSGKADYGITGSDILLDFAKGAPVVVVGAIFQHSPYIVISLRKDNYSSPSDLIGKRIMTSPDQGWVHLQAMFLNEGIPLDSIKLVPHTWNNNDLVSGNADAITGYSSVELYQFQKLGIPVNYLRPSNYGIDFYGDVLFSLRSTVDDHPLTTEKFIRATFKGWQYAMTHQEELAEYILTLPGVKERNVLKSDLMYEAEEMNKLILPQLVEIGHMNEGRWQHILGIYQKLGLVSDEQTLDGFMYSPMKDSLEHYLKTGFYILVGGCILFAILFIYNYTLRRAVARRTVELRKEVQERRRNELMLEEISKELKGSNEELKQFTFLTSHNLRAPVSNLISLATLFRQDGLSEKNQTYLTNIKSCIYNLDNTLADLNEILSVRSSAAEMQELDFNIELDFVIESISEQVADTGTIIHRDFNAVSNISYSRKALQSIMQNLITNAIKYSKDGTNPEIHIRSQERDGFVILEVMDKGQGIDLKKYGHKLFGLYQRFTNNKEGKGLGLYIINNQVNKLGGHIEVESTIGEGSTFTVYLKKSNEEWKVKE